MTTRITQRLMVQHSLTSLQLGMGRLSDTQEKLSTGRQINRPSDSPTGTNDAMRMRAQIAADDQHARNAQDGLAWMGTTDSTMQSMLDQVRRARDLLVQASSTGSNGPDALAAIGSELGQIKESLFALANTQQLGRPIFGGTTGQPAAYAKDATTGAVTFVGDTNDVKRQIGTGVTVAINVDGDAAFKDASGNNLFNVVQNAIDALGNSTDTGKALDQLDSVTENMKTSLADLGARYGRVEDAQTRLASTTLDNKTALSDIENVDLAEATMNLQLQEVAYQASLGATARVLQPSLVDFLK
ncbi:MAG: flagellar hook-associated protein FlgL [Nocardioidaceae bacterium]